MHPLLGGFALRWGRRRGDLSLGQHEVLRRQAEEQAQAEQEERGHHRDFHHYNHPSQRHQSQEEGGEAGIDKQTGQVCGW